MPDTTINAQLLCKYPSTESQNHEKMNCFPGENSENRRPFHCSNNMIKISSSSPANHQNPAFRYTSLLYKIIHMQVVHQYQPEITLSKAPVTTLIDKFLTWCASQENNRLLWLAIIVTGHGCILTPITVMIVMLTGSSFALYALALAAMAMSLIVNLAALPVKITLPVFAVSLVIDFTVIAISFAGLL
jgi:hypothetical protein